MINIVLRVKRTRERKGPSDAYNTFDRKWESRATIKFGRMVGMVVKTIIKNGCSISGKKRGGASSRAESTRTVNVAV